MSSIAALGLRFAAIRLLTGRTYADGRVFDSAIAPIDHMAQSQNEAFIIVSSEDEDVETKGFDVTGGERTVDLVIEIALAHQVEAQEGGVTYLMPSTDAGLELTLSLISRQVMRTLFEGPTSSPWASLFKRIGAQVRGITSRRGAGNDNDNRFAARQIVIRFSPVADPDFGALPGAGHVWRDFLDAMEGDPELASLAPLLQASIEGEDIPDWDEPRAAGGFTRAAAHNLGIGELPEGEAPPIAQEIDVADENGTTQYTVKPEGA